MPMLFDFTYSWDGWGHDSHKYYAYLEDDMYYKDEDFKHIYHLTEKGKEMHNRYYNISPVSKEKAKEIFSALKEEIEKKQKDLIVLEEFIK